MMIIEILINGAGCVKCERAQAIINNVLEKYEGKVKVIKTDIIKNTDKIREYNIMSTPAVIINGTLEFEGLPNEHKLNKKIQEALK